VREPGRREAGLFEDERHVIRQPDPRDHVDRRAEREAEGGGRGFTGGILTCLDEPRLRGVATFAHLLGKAHRAGAVEVDPRREDVGAAAPDSLDPLLAGELVEGSSNGDDRAAVAGRELALWRDSVAGLQLIGIERSLQVQVDLVMQRNRTELQAVVGQLRVEPRGCGRPEC